MKKLTDADKKEIWEEVRKEFPNDEMMQEIHYVRLLLSSSGVYAFPDTTVEGNFPGQGQVKFFIKGEEVFVTTPSNKFITSLKDGINNPFVRKALGQ